MRRNFIIPVIILLLAVWGLWVQSLPHRPDQIKLGLGVAETRWLSDYEPKLKNTKGDTPIYVLEGKEPGGTGVVLGGTHANEISGILASVLLVENVQMDRGRLLIIPHTNNSAISNVQPLRGEPWRVMIPSNDGSERSFRYGSRYTHHLHQWPDNYYFDHSLSNEIINGAEERNLNRIHPGLGDTLTEHISQAIVNLLIEENADFVLDFHEASPNSRLAHNMVVNPKSLELGAEVVINLMFEGLDFHLETSSEGFRGLSHRELGDATQAHAFLTETANPYQGAFYTDSSYETIINGKESGYGQRLEQVRFPFAQYGDLAMDVRVGRQVAALKEILNAISMHNPKRGFTGLIPSYAQIVEKGLTTYF